MSTLDMSRALTFLSTVDMSRDLSCQHLTCQQLTCQELFINHDQYKVTKVLRGEIKNSKESLLNAFVITSRVKDTVKHIMNE